MANLTVEELKVLISAETAGLQKAVSKVQSQLNGLDKTTTKITTKMGNAFSKLAKSAGITLTIAGLIRLGKSAVQAASALEEVQNVVDVSFGEAAAEIDRFAKTCMDRFGLSEYSAKKMASQFMAMGNSMGIANANSKIMSVQLTGLAADLASFFNVSVETAQNALEGVYTGQTRALRQFGLVVDEATIEEYALSQGITKSVRAMTAAEQATLRYNYVLQQTTNAQNDFARTSGTWANQIRLLRQQWNAFMTELGSVITAVLLPVVKWLNTILAYLTAIVRAFKAVFGFGGSSAEKASKSLGNMSVSAGGLSENLGSATAKAKELKKTIAGFDELEILNGPDEDSGSGGGSVSPIGGGGYDVGEYFDPEDWETPDLTEFQKKMEEIFQSWKDGWNDLTNALKENTTTIQNLFDWKKILGLAGLAGVIGLIVKFFDKDMFIKLLEGFKKIGYPGLGIGGWFAALGTTIGNALAKAGKAIAAFLGDPFALLRNAFATLKAFVINVWNGISVGFAMVKDGLVAGVKAIIGAFTPFTAALAALAAGFIWCWTTSEDFRKAVIDLWNTACKPFVDNLINSVKTMWNDHLKPL